MKYRLLVIGLLSIVSFRADSKNSDRFMLAGTAIHSFEDSQYVIQTDRYFFRVTKSKLTPEMRVELDRAVELSQQRGFTIPHQAISYAWPVSPSPKSDLGVGIAQTSTNSKELRDHIVRNADQIEIAGTVAMSFQDSHYMVLSDGVLYLILKNSLSNKENEHVAKTSVGEHVELSLPASSLHLVGRFSETADTARIAKKAESENVRTNGRHVTISGIVFHSFSEPLVIIRANQTYFQLKRARIAGPANLKLDLPGTFVNVRAPLDAVDFVWTTPIDDNTTSLRAPASKVDR